MTKATGVWTHLIYPRAVTVVGAAVAQLEVPTGEAFIVSRAPAALITAFTMTHQPVSLTFITVCIVLQEGHWVGFRVTTTIYKFLPIDFVHKAEVFVLQDVNFS